MGPDGTSGWQVKLSPSTMTDFTGCLDSTKPWDSISILFAERRRNSINTSTGFLRLWRRSTHSWSPTTCQETLMLEFKSWDSRQTNGASSTNLLNDSRYYTMSNWHWWMKKTTRIDFGWHCPAGGHIVRSVSRTPIGTQGPDQGREAIKKTDIWSSTPETRRNTTHSGDTYYNSNSNNGHRTDRQA
jgi:hypothetical protein